VGRVINAYDDWREKWMKIAIGIIVLFIFCIIVPGVSAQTSDYDCLVQGSGWLYDGKVLTAKINDLNKLWWAYPIDSLGGWLDITFYPTYSVKIPILIPPSFRKSLRPTRIEGELYYVLDFDEDGNWVVLQGVEDEDYTMHDIKLEVHDNYPNPDTVIISKDGMLPRTCNVRMGDFTIICTQSDL
jgi:hypothetical protein